MVPLCTSVHTGFLQSHLPFLVVFPCSSMGHPQAAVASGVSLLWCVSPYSHSPSHVSLSWQSTPLTWRASFQESPAAISAVPSAACLQPRLQDGLRPCASSPHDRGSPLNKYLLAAAWGLWLQWVSGGARTGCNRLQPASGSCQLSPTTQTCQALQHIPLTYHSFGHKKAFWNSEDFRGWGGMKSIWPWSYK